MKKFKYVFLIIFIISLIYQGICMISLELTLSTIQKLILIVIQSLAIIGWTYFEIYNQKPQVQYQYIRYAHIMIFLIYIFDLIYVLLFDPSLSRSSQAFVDYNHVNLEIMKTIRIFINGYQSGVIHLDDIFINIFGNICIFMPMAYFLPYFLKSQRKWYLFFFTIAIMVLGIELLQVYLQTGFGDIDDWLLNVSGAMFLYGIFKCMKIEKVYKMIGRSK